MNPVEKVRSRIREDLSRAGLELTPAIEAKIANQFTELLCEYVAAPENSKEEVYARGEKRILAIVSGQAVAV